MYQAFLFCFVSCFFFLVFFLLSNLHKRFPMKYTNIAFDSCNALTDLKMNKKSTLIVKKPDIVTL